MVLILIGRPTTPTKIPFPHKLKNVHYETVAVSSKDTE